MQLIPKPIRKYIKERLRERLGKDEVSLYFDLGDYIERKIGHIPIGIDFFVPSKKILKELLQNRIDDDKELGPLLNDDTIRHHVGEEEKPDIFFTQLSLYVFTKRIAILKRWLADELERSTILEVGDSDGLILKNLGKTGVGCNISAGAIENIRHHGIEAVQCDINHHPFSPKSFDIVMMFQTLEHVANPIDILNILTEIAIRKVIISIPKVDRTNIFPAGYQKNQPQYRQHIFEFSDEDFEKILTHTPLIINRKEIVNVFGKPKNFAQLRMYIYHHCNYIWHGIFREFAYYELVFRR